MSKLKLYMVLIGCTPPGRHIEQHDFFFGIAPTLAHLIPEMKLFWPEAAEKFHIDGWREVNVADGYRLEITLRSEFTDPSPTPSKKLFFINLGGYQENRFEEQHYVLLTVKDDKAAAFREAKETLFYQHNHFAGATSHIDDKYGIDVDELYEITDILSPAQKEKYNIELIPDTDAVADQLHLGYLKVSSLI